MKREEKNQNYSKSISSTVNQKNHKKNLPVNNVHKQLKAPFIVYADFESKLVETKHVENMVKTGINPPSPPPTQEGATDQKKNTNTLPYNTHTATSCAYKIVSFNCEECHIDDSYFTYCTEMFIEDREKLRKYLMLTLRQVNRCTHLKRNGAQYS